MWYYALVGAPRQHLNMLLMQDRTFMRWPNRRPLASLPQSKNPETTAGLSGNRRYSRAQKLAGESPLNRSPTPAKCHLRTPCPPPPSPWAALFPHTGPRTSLYGPHLFEAVARPNLVKRREVIVQHLHQFFHSQLFSGEREAHKVGEQNRHVFEVLGRNQSLRAQLIGHFGGKDIQQQRFRYTLFD